MSFVRLREGGRLRKTVILIGLAFFTFWSVAPILWLIISSLLEQKALIAQPPDLSPQNFTFENFSTVLAAAAALGRGIANSLIVSLFSTALALVLGAPAAYALARLPVPRANSIAFLSTVPSLAPSALTPYPL